MIAIDDLEPLPYKPNGFESTTDETLYLSIKSIGLQDPFVIATRPNDCKYTLIAGGNSRLRALHQLRSETEDERFSRVPCLIAEWPGIFQACLAHIITNDVRINRSFLDRARSLTHIVETHGHKAKGREISQRDAVAMLSENGYPISQAAYSYMVYLVQRLTPHLADELLEQLGLADVRQVRELENRMNEQVCRKGIPGHEFTAMFDRALAMTDRSIWEFDIFLTQVDQNVSSQLNEHVRRLSDSAQIERTGVEYELPQNGVTTETDLPRVELGHAPNSQYKDWEESDRERGDATTGFASKSELPISVDAFELTSSKVRHLRNSSYKLALKLCQGLSIDDACITKSTTGCGFRLDGGTSRNWSLYSRKHLHTWMRFPK